MIQEHMLVVSNECETPVWGWLDADKQTIGHRSNIRVSTKTIKGGGGQWKVKGKEQKGVGR